VDLQISLDDDGFMTSFKGFLLNHTAAIPLRACPALCHTLSTLIQSPTFKDNILTGETCAKAFGDAIFSSPLKPEFVSTANKIGQWIAVKQTMPAKASSCFESPNELEHFLKLRTEIVFHVVEGLHEICKDADGVLQVKCAVKCLRAAGSTVICLDTTAENLEEWVTLWGRMLAVTDSQDVLAIHQSYLDSAAQNCKDFLNRYQ